MQHAVLGPYTKTWEQISIMSNDCNLFCQVWCRCFKFYLYCIKPNKSSIRVSVSPANNLVLGPYTKKWEQISIMSNDCNLFCQVWCRCFKFYLYCIKPNKSSIRVSVSPANNLVLGPYTKKWEQISIMSNDCNLFCQVWCRCFKLYLYWTKQV